MKNSFIFLSGILIGLITLSLILTIGVKYEEYVYYKDMNTEYYEEDEELIDSIFIVEI